MQVRGGGEAALAKETKIVKVNSVVVVICAESCLFFCPQFVCRFRICTYRELYLVAYRTKSS